MRTLKSISDRLNQARNKTYTHNTSSTAKENTQINNSTEMFCGTLEDAIDLYYDDKIDDAIHILEKISKNDPTSKCYHYLGLCYSSQNEYRKAIDHFNLSLDINPNNVKSLIEKGSILYEHLDKFDEAIDLADIAISLNSQNAWGYSLRGKVHYAKSEFNKAIKDFTKAIILDKGEFAWFYYYRGVSYKANEQLNKAKCDIERAIQVKDSVQNFYYELGLIQNTLDEDLEAIQSISKAIDLCENDVPASYFGNRGSIYSFLGDYDKAIVDLEKAITLDPKYDFAYKIIGYIYMELEKEEEALDNYKKAVDIDVDYSDAYDKMALCYLILDNMEIAKEAAEEALEINPNLITSLNILGTYYLNIEQQVRAKRYFSRSLDIDPEHEYAIEHLQKCN
ncbi:tetratricopeptide repeat protein [Flammeovirga yaeyamensis]|uniref:Tetratricopeptide repeat protein n=1 Tax=Flammeovirga yaeyamensis TaxID=367791 RepID=A0AAX1N2Z0_9BACT|nr:tetratricopeptide repeat protein [Flammeovirga yaeyamensis]MBB3701205.1 tetratricopeptide (TPR) repeat protein [Flammeovirga yaeyamensis]NMF38469.1 tetratricopeptide repeat protein [Flammeovirga yaeyamensis]QWG01671.1 tetratricopeptide repeat protein [Flammeovirga yaeyamensis]